MNFKQQRDAFRERKISAKEAVQNALERVKADQNNIFINHFETEALNIAEEIDNNFENFKGLPLSGVPTVSYTHLTLPTKRIV